MYSYLEAELEAWTGLVEAVLPGAVLVLYLISLGVLTTYSLYYIAAVAAYLEHGPPRPGSWRPPGGVLYSVGAGERLGYPSPEGWPRVAVVYPVFNDYEILSSIDAARRLDYPDYIILVVDDSTDSSLSRRISNIALEDGRVMHVRRPGRRGLKAGALNDAASLAHEMGAKYMLILDADFEPPPGLLREMVAYAEETGANVVQGHQRHVKGATGVFGRLYRAGMAGAVVLMSGRERLSLFPIFTGSVALLRVDKVLDVPFKEGSISEDLRWTIDALVEDKASPVRVLPQVYADGSVPTGFRAFYRQQVRWSEGTLREAMETWYQVLLDRGISGRERLGYLLQTLFYTQGPWVYVNTLAPFIYAQLTGSPVPIVWLLGIYFWFMGIEMLILAGSIQEGMDTRTLLVVALTLLLYIYVTALVHSIGTFRALAGLGGSWSVTPKRGEHEEEYMERG